MNFFLNALSNYIFSDYIIKGVIMPRAKPSSKSAEAADGAEMTTYGRNGRDGFQRGVDAVEDLTARVINVVTQQLSGNQSQNLLLKLLKPVFKEIRKIPELMDKLSTNKEEILVRGLHNLLEHISKVKPQVAQVLRAIDREFPEIKKTAKLKIQSAVKKIDRFLNSLQNKLQKFIKQKLGWLNLAGVFSRKPSRKPDQEMQEMRSLLRPRPQ